MITRKYIPKTSSSSSSDDVDVSDVLGFDRDRHSTDEERRRKEWNNATKAHFSNAGHFDTIDFGSVVERNKEAAILAEQKKEEARANFQKQLAEKREKEAAEEHAVREKAVDALINPEGKSKLSNPIFAFTNRADTEKDKFPTVQSEQRGVVANERIILDTDSKKVESIKFESEKAKAKERDDDPRLAPRVAIDQREQMSSTRTDEQSDGSASSYNAAAMSAQNNNSFVNDEARTTDEIISRQNLARRAAEASERNLATTNLSAPTGSRPGEVEGPLSSSAGPVLSEFQSNEINRNFTSPTTSIVGNAEREQTNERVLALTEKEQSKRLEQAVVYERGAMVVCTERLRPGSDLAIVLSPTEQNAESRYLTVCPIERRNSELNKDCAVDMPQSRGCFTIRCDWVRTIEVDMVSRVEQAQIPRERMAAVETALLNAVGMQRLAPEASVDDASKAADT